MLTRTADLDKWKKATFWVFDTPNYNQTFEARIQLLKNLKNQELLPSFVHIVDTVVCQHKQHLKEYLTNIIVKGGEGVMLREAQSLYKAGRSASLCKFKPFFDSEVKVLENNYPHGLLCIQYQNYLIKF